MKHVIRPVLDINRIKDWKGDHSTMIGWERHYYEMALLIKRENVISIPEPLKKYIITDFSGFENIPEDIDNYYVFLFPWIFTTREDLGIEYLQYGISNRQEKFIKLFTSFLGVNS